MSFIASEDKFNFLKGVRNENQVFKTNFGGDVFNKSPISEELELNLVELAVFVSEANNKNILVDESLKR
ncbi:hypothetical protein MASR2M54_23630 [Aliarcobacter cryaerophilus]